MMFLSFNEYLIKILTTDEMNCLNNIIITIRGQTKLNNINGLM